MANDNPVFTAEQVVDLWHWQFGPWRSPWDAPTEETKHLPMQMHPFTCPHRHNHPELAGDKGILVPTTRGWICPFCSYTQTWAHDFMLNTR